MHKSIGKVLLLFLLFCPPAISAAQAVYNLNVDNGLPTNYAYCMLTDRHGYLWIATPKGVIRYNGYETALFNCGSGLPQEDVWRLYEDKKGRIWLSGISRQVGYIYNNKYRTVFNPINKTLYPHEIRDHDSGIFFFSIYQDEKNKTDALYIEQHDTIYCKILDSAMTPAVSNNAANVTLIRNDSIYKLDPDFDVHSNRYIKQITYVNKYLPGAQLSLLGNHFLYTKKNDPHIWIIDPKKNDTSLYRDMRENIQLIFNPDDNYRSSNTDYAIITDKTIYTIDTALRIGKATDISTITGRDVANISFYICNNLWGQCLSTTDKGVYLDLRAYGQLKKLPPGGLTGFKYIGHPTGAYSYWWDNSTHRLAQVKNDKVIRYSSCTGVYSPEDIISYSKNFSLLITRKFIYLLDNRSLKLTNFLDKFHWGYNKYKVVNSSSTWDACKALINTPESFYLLTKVQGVYNFCYRHDSLVAYNINRDRFNDMVYDSARRAFCLYSTDNVEVYRDSVRTCSFQRDALKQAGVKHIEKIIPGMQGNIFLKEYDRLLVFDKHLCSYRNLFQHYMLDGATVNIYRNILVVIGKFGVLFSRIDGPQKLSQEIVYRNIKNTSYNYVRDVQVTDNNVLLNTDKGMYEAEIPAAEAFDHTTTGSFQPFRLLLSYHDTIHAVTPGTTISIDQEDLKLELDAINPAGIGKLAYRYFIKGTDTDWHESNTGNILLSQLLPGNTYILSVSVHDDILKSSPVNLRLYIIPYWWQRPAWVKTFWICGLILLLAFGYSVAFFTRRTVTRNNQKKSQLLELKLNAVYSQINPHFIYNTLNSALLLIHNGKMQEAYTHVSKFSRLLRAYVQSSRNKYITVSDEITNLKNYIELQQVRFRNKFHYEIKIDGDDQVNDIKIPSLLLQPFVENAINHGLTPKEDTGHLEIVFRAASGNELICIITDDGIGREKARSFKGTEKKDAYGDQLVKDLVRIFNTYESMHIEIQYIDRSAPLTGTTVEIRIKTL